MAADLLAAQVWHHFLSFFIFFPVLFIVIGIIIGYLAKVVAPKYGRR
jgi:hypothetical protein